MGTATWKGPQSGPFPCRCAIRIVELEDEPRLVELEDRVDFFPVRADRSEIDRTSGEAARSEYDAVLDLMARKPAAGAPLSQPDPCLDPSDAELQERLYIESRLQRDNQDDMAHCLA